MIRKAKDWAALAVPEVWTDGLTHIWSGGRIIALGSPRLCWDEVLGVCLTDEGWTYPIEQIDAWKYDPVDA